MDLSKNMQKLRRDALAILKRSLHEVNAEHLISTKISLSGDKLNIPDKTIDLSKVRRLFVVGCGKGAAAMAHIIEEIMGERIAGGVISVKYGHALPLQRIRCYEAGHPIPDEAGIEATLSLVALLKELGENDLVLVLLTGGGSALLELPADGISIQDLQITTLALLSCGAEIDEINAVRKHLSRVKGGQLLAFAHPARVVTLAISDVIGDIPGAIASGPTVPDDTTYSDAWDVLGKYSLQCRIPEAVIEHLQNGIEGRIAETPKPGDKLFESTCFKIIGHNRILLEAGRKAAQQLGYHPVILTDRMRGEASQMGRKLASLAANVRSSSWENDVGICLLASGETTVVLSGSGTGGRNQELALAAAIQLDGSAGCVLLAAGSDGTDGPTDAAGALVDGTTVSRGRERGHEPVAYLRRHDSYSYFKESGDLVITGPTGTNVMDVVICLID